MGDQDTINDPLSKKAKTANARDFGVGPSGLFGIGNSLALALQANRRRKPRTTFISGSSSSGVLEKAVSTQKSIAFNHVVFHAKSDSRSGLTTTSRATSRFSESTSRMVSQPSLPHRDSQLRTRNGSKTTSNSLWSHVMVGGFRTR
jgi:hypothetical protein